MFGAPQRRLDLGARFGVDRSWDVTATTGEERAEALRAETGGRGADVVIEAAGHPSAIPEGFRSVRDGGVYVIAGHYTDAGDAPFNPHADINRKHIDVRGQWGTEFHHVVRALRVFARHRARLPFREVIGARYGLEEAGRALEDVEALRVTKAIIAP
jgi:threonine dehydrogenase-like Zn-dependent dehydrogenase